MGNAFLTAT